MLCHCFFLMLVLLDLLSKFYVSDGNGFKTSTMRLGADVIVFSRCHGKNGRFAFFISYIITLCIILIYASLGSFVDEEQEDFQDIKKNLSCSTS